MTEQTSLIDTVRTEFGDGRFFAVDETIEVECEMLARAGVTVKDFDVAFDAWGRARRVSEDWGYLRTVMWRRAVERELLLRTG